MTLVGRDALGKVFSSAPYLEWAARPGNLTDANKLKEEFRGNKRATCGSKYAQGLQTLCRENPPATPPATSSLASVWQLDAAFTNGGLSNFNGPPRDRALATGWKAVYIQLLHIEQQQIEANLAEMILPAWNPWVKVGWGTYGQGSDPEADGRNAAAVCKAHPVLKGWKANGEAWAEETMAWKTSAFVKGWTEGGAPVPLGWSVLSSDTANFARAYDYASALAVAGADIDIQVYGATVPTYTVGAGLGMLSKVPVPVDRTAMSFDVTNEGVGPFPDYRTWAGPRRLWNVGNATVATFDALVR